MDNEANFVPSVAVTIGVLAAYLIRCWKAHTSPDLTEMIRMLLASSSIVGEPF